MRVLVAVVPIATLLGACVDARSRRIPVVPTCEAPELRASARWTHLAIPSAPVSETQTWGGGAVVGDFGRTGALDVVVLEERGARYLEVRRTDEGAEAVDRTEAHGAVLADLPGLVGGAAVDLDGDGWTDLVLSRWEAPNVVLLNDGSGGFVDATPPALRAHALRTQSVTVGDLDGDGDLDLFFGNYGARPDGPHHTPPADPAELYRNDGDGWTDLSDTLPPRIRDGYTFMSALHDLDGDRLPELLAFHDFSNDRPSVIGWNRGDLGFDAVETWMGIGLMGLATAELDGDGLPDFLLTSNTRNYLYRSGGPRDTWVDATVAWGLTVDLEDAHQDFGWGAEFGDLDNDGDEDAVAAFGFWEDWPELGATAQRDAVYEQVAPLWFEDRAAAWELDDAGAGRGVVLADLDRDGWLDVVKRQLGDDTLVRLARCGEAGWSRVTLEGPAPNTQGIGAVVRLTADGQTRTRWIQSGQTSLYSGAAPEAHFGLGQADRIERVEVVWPDGTLQVLEDLPVREEIRVRYSNR